MFLLIPFQVTLISGKIAIFTFQYVSINTLLYLYKKAVGSRFTFQYVSINTST